MMRLPCLKNQQGLAMFVTVMILSLGTTFAFLAFQVSSTELQISRHSEDEVVAQYLAESGVEKVLSWGTLPATSPDPAFFASLPEGNCVGDRDHPDFPQPSFPNYSDYLTDPSPSGPFSELKNSGKIIDLRLYAPTHLSGGICTVEVVSETATGASAKVRVNISLNPLGKITAGIQGAGNSSNPSPMLAHWGKVRYTGQAHLGSDIAAAPILDPFAFPTNQTFSLRLEDPFMALDVENEIVSPVPDNGDTYLARPNITQNKGSDVVLDKIKVKRLRSFVKKHGAYYTVSPDGQHLLKNGAHILDEDGKHIDSFDHVFNGKVSKNHLVWIDNHSAPALKIHGGKFKGYFYFSGPIEIEGNVTGRNFIAPSPPVASYPNGVDVFLMNINLEGLFLSQETIEIEHRFTVYGAMYSFDGFTGAGASQLEVWYNSRFAQSLYPGIRTVTPLIGTWVSAPLDES